MKYKLTDLRDEPLEVWDDASPVFAEIEEKFQMLDPLDDRVVIDVKWADGAAMLCVNVYLLEENWKMYNYTDGFTG